jgi:ribosomal protein S6
LRPYEGLFILDDTLPEDRTQEIVGRVRGEIEKLGATVSDVQVLGRRQFARKLNKRGSGFYVRMAFAMGEDKIGALSSRLRLIENVFRSEITRAVADVGGAPAGARTSTPASPAEGGRAG